MSFLANTKTNVNSAKVPTEMCSSSRTQMVKKSHWRWYLKKCYKNKNFYKNICKAKNKLWWVWRIGLSWSCMRMRKIRIISILCVSIVMVVICWIISPSSRTRYLILRLLLKYWVKLSKGWRCCIRRGTCIVILNHRTYYSKNRPTKINL